MAKKQPQEAAANAKLTTSNVKTSQVADVTNKALEYVKQHPQYVTLPTVQAAATTWQTSATALQKIDTDIQSMHLSLTALIAARSAGTADWKRATKSMLNVIDQVTGGSAKAIKEWGFDVNTRVVAPAVTDPPQGLRVHYTKSLDLVVQWKSVKGHLGYLLQIGDGTPTGWGTAIAVTKVRYLPTGLTAGQHITLRVAVQRKSGISAYCDPISVIVR